MEKPQDKSDELENYLQIGAQLPTQESNSKLMAFSRDEQLQLWKQDHSQATLHGIPFGGGWLQARQSLRLFAHGCQGCKFVC
jgi:hypothetical protein